VVVYNDVELADGVRIWHNAVIRNHVTIGRGSSVGSLSCIEHHTQIGAGTSVHSLCQVGDYSKIGDAVFIGPGFLSVSDLRLDFRRPQLHETYRGVTIKDRARLGGRVLAYPGSVVGVETVVGAGGTIRGELLDGVVYMGDPLRAVRKVRPDERLPGAEDSS
jgi:acetyltransferase-like isoleucine patch superfamily enzyme